MSTTLKWGTVVAAGLALTSATLWVNHTWRQVEAPDMIELVEGVKERAAVHTNLSLPPSGEITPIVSRAQMQWVMTSAKALVPYFVNPATNVNAVSGAAVMLTVTGLWHTLQIGDGTNKWTVSPCWTNAPYTNWVYAYTNWYPSNDAPHSLCYTAREFHAVSYATNLTTNGYGWGTYSNAAEQVVPAKVRPAIYSNTLDTVQVIYKETFIECYKVLHALSNTTRAAVWTNSTGVYGAVGDSVVTPYLFSPTPPGPDPDVFSPLAELTWGAPNAWITGTYPGWGIMSTEEMNVPEWLQHPDTYTYFWDLTTAASVATQYTPAATAPLRYGLASYRFKANGFYGWNVHMIFNNSPFGPCWSIGDPWPSEPGCLSTWLWDGPYAFKQCTIENNTNKYNLVTSMLVVGTGTNDLGRSVQFWGKTGTVYQVLDVPAAGASDIVLSDVIAPSEFSNPEGGDDTPWNALSRPDQAYGPNNADVYLRYEYDNNAANSIDITPVHTETKTVTKGPAIITWTFERCTEELP